MNSIMTHYHVPDEKEAFKKIGHVIENHITRVALNKGIRFRYQPELAVISGAGIAGLAASFELIAKGFKVVVVEKRNTFSRSNIINLNVETQYFLKKFGLLKEFEESVAGRISTHRYVHIGKKSIQDLGVSDVSELQLSDTSFEAEHADKLFNHDGIYSVKIGDLQTFLAKKLLEAGGSLFREVEVDVLDRTEAGGASELNIRGINSSFNKTLQPDLFFIAEGAHSTTAKQLGITVNQVKNECTDENWIFGNADYCGKKTCVVSIIDTSAGHLEIANVIFNAKVQEVNIAVTSEQSLTQKEIKQRILNVMKQAFDLQEMDQIPHCLKSVVKQPVHIENETRDPFSIDNIFLIGDAAGRSSPLAGLGGTLGLTLIPRTIHQLLRDRNEQPAHLHPHFKQFSDDYTSRWIQKSANVKIFCLGILDKERKAVDPCESPLKERGSDEA
ncbi:MAG: FAD-dependent monooxygenase [Parachlamydiaceae bacterium]